MIDSVAANSNLFNKMDILIQCCLSVFKCRPKMLLEDFSFNI